MLGLVSGSPAPMTAPAKGRTRAPPLLRFSNALVHVGSAARLRDEVEHTAVRGHPAGHQRRLLREYRRPGAPCVTRPPVSAAPGSAQHTPRACGLHTRSQTLLGRPGTGLAGGVSELDRLSLSVVSVCGWLPVVVRLCRHPTSCIPSGWLAAFGQAS